MITNHILEDKWRVQKELDEQAGYDPGSYIALAHKRAVAAEERYGIRFRYVDTDASSREEPLPVESAKRSTGSET
jgi:hypothetical protein